MLHTGSSLRVPSPWGSCSEGGGLGAALERQYQKSGYHVTCTGTNGSSMPQHAAAPDSGSCWWGF